MRYKRAIPLFKCSICKKVKIFKSKSKTKAAHSQNEYRIFVGMQLRELNIILKCSELSKPNIQII